MMTLIAAIVTVLVTIPVVAVVVTASYLRVPIRHGSIYEKVQYFWARAVVRGSGVRTHVHGAEHIEQRGPCVYVANHVSWYDVFCLASVLPRWSFVAKAELRKIPIFGRGAEAVGTIFVERKNRRAAFQMYETAAVRIREGASVVVYAEGTRGDEYALRPFKKGPFVLAISAGVPIIPVLIMGTREVMKRGQWLVSPGDVHLHFLPPIPTAGLQYGERDVLVEQVWSTMAGALSTLYGIQSDRRNASGAEEPVEVAVPTPEAPVMTQ
ncbi:MAG TPA: lysophospholipid acyltransferase family protein [Gemmatimonadaceae bacterium]|nr:lysophospholipid acyltransferase family protein [Gemmatimonadaceae bacterium]